MKRERKLRGEGGNVDQRTVSPRQHATQRGLGKSRRLHEHGFDLLLPNGEFRRHELGKYAEPGVVDHNIESTGRTVSCQKRLFRPAARSQIQRHGSEVRRATGREIIQPGRVARGAPDAHPLAEQHFGKRPAESRARPGDERGAVDFGKGWLGHGNGVIRSGSTRGEFNPRHPTTA